MYTTVCIRCSTYCQYVHVVNVVTTCTAACHAYDGHRCMHAIWAQAEANCSKQMTVPGRLCSNPLPNTHTRHFAELLHTGYSPQTPHSLTPLIPAVYTR
jgi:hypothetical protein